MALAPTPRNTTPNVPPGPGVPALFRANPVTTGFLKVQLLLQDAAGVLGLFLVPHWGVFNFIGQPMVVPDSFVSMDYRKDFRISDYVTEKGGFQSYDKVEMPFDARVTMACGGVNMTKDKFLSAIDGAVKSLDQYHVLTPDADYRWCNLIHYDYRRTRGTGGGLLIVDLWLQQIRDNASTTYTNTKEPSGATNEAKGTVQPTSAPANLTASGSGFHLGGT